MPEITTFLFEEDGESAALNENQTDVIATEADPEVPQSLVNMDSVHLSSQATEFEVVVTEVNWAVVSNTEFEVQ